MGFQCRSMELAQSYNSFILQRIDTNQLPDRPFHNFRELKIRQWTVPNYIKFLDQHILRLWNCERVGRVDLAAAQKQRGREKVQKS